MGPPSRGSSTVSELAVRGGRHRSASFPSACRWRYFAGWGDRSSIRRADRGRTVLHVVAEDEGRAAGDDAAGFQDVQIDVEGDFAKRDDHLQFGQEFQFALEVRAAVAQFLWSRFVPGGAQWAAAVM